MDWTLFITVIGTGLTVAGLVYAFLRNFKQDVNSHIDSVNHRINRIEKKMDIHNQRMEAHTERIDRLYVMFVDLLKNPPRTHP